MPKKRISRPEAKPEATWSKASASPRRRGSGGSVAQAILNQSPQSKPGTSAGAMRSTNAEIAPIPRISDVHPAPATGVGDPDRDPQASPSAARSRRARSR